MHYIYYYSSTRGSEEHLCLRGGPACGPRAKAVRADMLARQLRRATSSVRRAAAVRALPLHHHQQQLASRAFASAAGPDDPTQRVPGAPVLDISVHPGGTPGIGGYHDLGGLDGAGPVLAVGADRPHAFWEKRVHALCGVLVSKGLLSVDEMRRGWEQLQPESYSKMTYYEKWASSITTIMLERGALTEAALVEQRGPEVESDTVVRFLPGNIVRVKREDEFKTRWRKPHLRTPGYCHGCYGVVERVAGVFSSPEALAFGGRDLAAQGSQPLYRVRFRQSDLWPGSAPTDTVDVEIYQSWLEHGPEGELPRAPSHVVAPAGGADSDHGHGHGHGEGEDDHDHGTRQETEAAAVALEEESLLPEPPVAAALVGALLHTGVVSAAEITGGIEAVDRLGQADGPVRSQPTASAPASQPHTQRMCYRSMQQPDGFAVQGQRCLTVSLRTYTAFCGFFCLLRESRCSQGRSARSW
jgi:hypothetical protein